ncbi:hypothetical protein Ahia01_000500300 [Argonauta hians]
MELSESGYFRRWTCSLQRVYEESDHVKQVRRKLQEKLLGHLFHRWHTYSSNSQTTKPLVVRCHQRLLLRVTQSWHQLVLRNHYCSTNCHILRTRRLAKYFTRWRKLFVAHEFNRHYNQKRSLCVTRLCLRAWRLMVDRKRHARHLHRNFLLWTSFCTWRQRATLQRRTNILRQMEMRLNILQQRSFFDQWRETTATEKEIRLAALVRMESLQRKNKMTLAFNGWRRMLTSVLLAREYHSCHQVVLARLVLVEWRWVTDRALSRAICLLQVTLQMGPWMKGVADGYHFDSSDYESQDSMETFQVGQMNLQDESSTSSLSVEGLRPENTIQLTPYDLVTANRLQKSMTRFVVTLKYWPVSAALYQWRQHTLICQQRRSQGELVKAWDQTLVISLHFTRWKNHHKMAALAQTHSDLNLKRKTVSRWRSYHELRQSKCALRARADTYSFHTVSLQIFPLWLAKTKKKCYWNQVAAIFDQKTLPELQLGLVEDQLRGKTVKRRVRRVIEVWHHSMVVNLRCRQHHNHRLTSRYLHQWRGWCQHRRHLAEECYRFQRRRIQALAIRTWIHAAKQRRVVADRKCTRLQQQLALVMLNWHRWAKAHHQQSTAAAQIQKTHTKLLQRQVFTSMKGEFHRHRTAINFHHQHLLNKVTLYWWRQSRRQLALNETFNTLVSLHKHHTVAQVFCVWKRSFVKSRADRKNHMEAVWKKVREITFHWRRKVQRTRGETLENIWQKKKLSCRFQQWRKHLTKLQELKQRVSEFNSWKNHRTFLNVLDHWRTAVLLQRAVRTYWIHSTSRVIIAWRKWTTECAQRRSNVKAHGATRLSRHLRVTFDSWETHWRHSVTATTWYKDRLRARSFASWERHVSKKRHLQVWSVELMLLLSQRRLHTSYTLWKSKARHRIAERTRQQRHQNMATQHFRTRLCHQVFQLWHNEVLVCRHVAQRQLTLCYKYFHRWQHRVTLVLAANIWNEKTLFERVWISWRHNFLRDSCVSRMVKEFRKQDLIQILRAWHQLCQLNNRNSVYHFPMIMPAPNNIGL